MLPKKRLAVVIPVHSEERNLTSLHARLERTIISLPAYNWTYIFINDGSLDNSLAILRNLAENDAKVLVLDLTRNFGKEIAITAGLHEARTFDAVICMDADHQHPPEIIPDLIQEWEDGAELVEALRRGISGRSCLRKLSARVYFWLMVRISSLPTSDGTTDFRLYDRKVVDAFCRITERGRMVRGIMDWMGFQKSSVEFHADARQSGTTSYSYHKLLNLALTGITSFSLWPLRMTGCLGCVITLGSGLLLAWMIGYRLFRDPLMYTPLALFVVANTFLIGIVLTAIGLVALYIGAIHTEVINRPLYIIRERIPDGAARKTEETEPA